MKVGIVGGGVNGLCCAWLLAQKGHCVRVFERDNLMCATSRASSKLLHGGLRYLENGEFRLVGEALRERDAWLSRAPELAKPLRLILPVYRGGRRHRLVIGVGMFLYDRLAAGSRLPPSTWLSAEAVIERSPGLNPEGLIGGYEFSDGQMDDYKLGLWVADQARSLGVEILERTEVKHIGPKGVVTTVAGVQECYDRVVNVAGPWAARLLSQSNIESPWRLDHIRGSHLVLQGRCPQSFLLEVPGERRIFFVLPWEGKTLVGTTEVRQHIDEPVTCSPGELDYLLAAYRYYFPNSPCDVLQVFSGLRPLLQGAKNPNRVSREYAIHRTQNIITVFGGKWTTAMALAEKVSRTLN